MKAIFITLKRIHIHTHPAVNSTQRFGTLNPVPTKYPHNYTKRNYLQGEHTTKKHSHVYFKLNVPLKVLSRVETALFPGLRIHQYLCIQFGAILATVMLVDMFLTLSKRRLDILKFVPHRK